MLESNQNPTDSESQPNHFDLTENESPAGRSWIRRRWWRSPVTWTSLVAVLLLATSQWWLVHALVLIGEDRLWGNTRDFGNLAQVQLRGRGVGQGELDLTGATVPHNEIRSGGPPKDGIPALTDPKLVGVRAAKYLQPNDRVIGFVRGQEARAYPLKILNYHEIVNDRVGEVPIAVTYCPLCDSVAVFDRRTELGEREFGVSGLLYNSNVLMYDRGGNESLWSQMQAEGISGPGVRRSLKSLPVDLTTWSDWVARHPNTKVLSPQTGHSRDYRRNPYAGYFEQPGLMFPVNRTDDRLPTKERVLGVWTDSASRAYPVSVFGGKPKRFEDRIEGKHIVIEFQPETQSLRVVEADEEVEWMYSLWFAWYAFRPETEVFQ